MNTKTTKKDFETCVEEFLQKMKVATPRVARGFANNCIKAANEFCRFCNAVLNLAVKAAIIAIAMIMVYNFLQANPAIAAEIDASWQTFTASVSEAIESMRNALPFVS